VVLVAVLTPMVLFDALAPARLRRFFSDAGESGRPQRSPAQGLGGMTGRLDRSG
jgi:hypothetical protein